MRLSKFLMIMALTLSACTGIERETPFQPGPEPNWPKLGSALPAGTTAYSNRSLARLFTLLTHGLEWGANRPALVRYEAPVRVTLSGPGTAPYRTFLSGYLGLLRDQAGVDIARAETSGNLHIRFVEGPVFRRALPTISCLVVSGDTSFDAFRRDPDRYGGAQLETARTQSQTTIFIPQTAPPYLVRGCLIEEIAQALGPANDLYGLGPSIFNDDAAHVWPTRLDLLMLKTLYQPELTTGLDRSETERRAWAVLDRLNPQGRDAPPLTLPRQRQMARWREVTQQTFSRDTSGPERRRLAQEALQLAQLVAPRSAYECRSMTARGRILVQSDPAEASRQLAAAERLCTRVHGADDIRIARLRLVHANAAFRQRRFSEALALTEGIEITLAAHALDERLATLYALRSNAFRAIQQGTKSFEARRLAKAWGEYALGIDNEALIAWLEK